MTANAILTRVYLKPEADSMQFENILKHYKNRNLVHKAGFDENKSKYFVDLCFENVENYFEFLGKKLKNVPLNRN